MSSTMKAPPSETNDGRPYVGFEEYIQFQLKLARQGIRGADLLTGAVGAVLLIAAYLLLFVVTDHWVIRGGWGSTARYLLWTGFVMGLGWWVWHKLIQPFTQRISQLYAATQLEGASPELKSSLLTLIDLKQAGRPVSPAIIESMERRAAVSLQRVNIDDAVDRHMLTKLSYALLGLVFVLCVYTVASPKSLVSSAWRALFPMAQVAPSTRTAILKVAPGDVTVLAHSTPDITAELSGVIPEEVRLLYTTADRRVVDEPIKLQDTGEGVNRFRARLVGENGAGLLQNLTYRVEAGDASSPTYSITVRQPPTANVSEIDYDYPTYMGLEDRTQPESAIDAWEGTTVTVRALANMKIDRATILFSDTEDTSIKAEELPMTIEGGVHLSATWQLKFRTDATFPRFYRIQLLRKSSDGEELVTVPTLHTQRIRADLPPKLDILYPTADMEMPANGTVPIAFEASDPDFLLKSVVLRYEKDGELLPKQELLFDAPPFEAKTRGKHLLRLEPFAVEPGKKLTFWLEAKDNFQPFADRLGNLTRSPRITMTVIEPVAPQQAQQEQAEQEQAADQKIAEAEQATNPPDDPPAEGAPQEPMDPTEPDQPKEQPAGEEPMPNQPMPEDGERKPGDEARPMPNQDDPGQEQQPGNPGEGQPQPNEPQKGKPQPGQPKDGSSPPDQAKPGEPNDPNQNPGQPQPNPATEPNNGQPQPNQTPPKGQPQPNKPKERKEKISPDEALENLLRRQKEREEERKQAEKPKEPGENEPEPKPMPNESRPGETQAKPSDGTGGKENQGPKKPMPSESTDPMTDTPPSDPGTEPMPGDDANNPPKASDPSNKTRPKEGEKSTKPGPKDSSKLGEKPELGQKEPSETEPRGPKDGMPEGADPSKPMPNGSKPDPTKPEPGLNEPGTKPDPSQPKTGPKPEVDPAKPVGNEPMPGDEKPMPNADGTQPGENSDGPQPMPKGPQDKPKEPGTKPGSGDEPMPNDPTEPGEPDEKPAPMPGTEPSEQPMPKDNPGEEPGPENPAPMKPKTNEKPQPNPGKEPGEQPGEPMLGEKSNPGEASSDPQEPMTPEQPGPEGPSKNPGPKKPGPKNTDPMKPGPSDKPEQPGDKPEAGDMPPGEPGQPGNEKQGDMPPKENSAEEQSGQPEKPVENPGQPSKPGTGKNPSGLGKPETGDMPPADAPTADDPSGQKPMPGGDKPGDKSGGDKPGGDMPGEGDQPGEGEKQQGTGKKPSDMPTGQKPMPGGQAPSEPSNDKPGDGEKPGDKPPGQDGPNEKAPGGKPGEGQKPGEPGGEKGKPGEAPQEGGEPGKPGKPGEGGASAPGEASEDQKGSGSSPARNPGKGDSGGSRTGDKNPEGTPGDGQAHGPDEAVDLENKRRAAALALKEIQDDLSRGDLSPEEINKLGFNDEEELDAFLKQLDQRLNNASDANSPESQSRQRQFDELLKGIDLESEGQFKSGGDHERKATESTGSNRRPAPNKYRQASEEYNKRIRGGDAKKK